MSDSERERDPCWFWPEPEEVWYAPEPDLREQWQPKFKERRVTDARDIGNPSEA